MAHFNRGGPGGGGSVLGGQDAPPPLLGDPKTSKREKRCARMRMWRVLVLYSYPLSQILYPSLLFIEYSPGMVMTNH